ncbi:tRNA 2'-phosphotransferase 1 isoform X2 [Antechinus flavipes]|uniref:tRNA 2'-phosphotransferase 1 isoform X2 n=1 Tax=Antechinus flavipes TaxID=38775 RepID=UPI0022365245|nr:tRNA 2'-phosphotransferase 1 isoform X2 [Antechinus flavipes]
MCGSPRLCPMPCATGPLRWGCPWAQDPSRPLADGFVPLDALLRLAQFRDFSEEDVRRVVRTNAKQRFALRPGPPGGCASIRANQGHSLQVADLELTPLSAPQDLPPVLVHGTYRRHWRSIRREGLSRRGRTHIHLCASLPGETHALSGMRPDCEVAVFIDGPSALADGIPFFCSANGVILTPGDARGFLPPKYFKEALQLGSPRRPLPLDEEETEGQSSHQDPSANT